MRIVNAKGEEMEGMEGKGCLIDEDGGREWEIRCDLMRELILVFMKKYAYWATIESVDKLVILELDDTQTLLVCGCGNHS